MAPLPTRLFPGTVREPDLLYVSPEHFPTDIRGYPDKIDLAVEIVSSGLEARKRDYIDKRIDYAKAGVAEYWIIDPEQELITVLSLQGDSYLLIGEYSSGQIAKGIFWERFSISVDQVLSIGKNQTKPRDA